MEHVCRTSVLGTLDHDIQCIVDLFFGRQERCMKAFSGFTFGYLHYPPCFIQDIARRCFQYLDIVQIYHRPGNDQ